MKTTVPWDLTALYRLMVTRKRASTMAGHDPNEPLPPYSYVPGGPWPHPNRARQGDFPWRMAAPLQASRDAEPALEARFRRGVELFNAGYYWEAHEVWEVLWHAYGRKGPAADVIKALIKLAAAGVKVRERQEHGVRTHARRAADLFAAVADRAGRHQFGIDLDLWASHARAIAQEPPQDPGPAGAPVVRVFGVTIEIESTRPSPP
jgi:hypothetical protein